MKYGLKFLNETQVEILLEYIPKRIQRIAITYFKGYARYR